MKSLKVPIILGVVLLLIALGVRTGWFARKDPGEPMNATARAAREDPQWSASDIRLIEERYGSARVMTSGLRYVVRTPGDGPMPVSGETVSVHYDGRLLSGGPFDSTYDRGTPMDLRVGTGEVLPGLDEALLTMRPGEKRTVIVPWWLGYGERGRPPLVPGRATLVYETELVSIGTGK
ncbi:MAG TPA: FKBP-type peptidyl-prolyl cis-trans isomerase [Opitutaceae bacterium]